MNRYQNKIAEIFPLKTESESHPLETFIVKKAAVIRFIRPQTKNTLSIAILKILEKQFENLNSFDNINTIIFTGSGDTFAAGADLKEIIELNEKTAIEFGLRGQNLLQKVYHSNKKTIAAIDGFCMGGGLDLVLSCKYRIASKRSVFAHPGAKLGIITGWGGTQLLPRLVGSKKALEIFLTAGKINADEALKIGLIDEICKNPLAKMLEKFGQ